MNKKEYQKFYKRYDKFKKNNLPTPFWDDERQVFEYVYDDEFVIENGAYSNQIKIFNNLTDALSEITLASFYYSYSCGYDVLNNNEKKLHHCHSHSFENVVRDLYDYPESFNISKEEEEFYSKQELNYLKRVQKYLLFIGLKDINEKRSVLRYRNKVYKKYGNSFVHKYSCDTINDFISGKRNFNVMEWYEGYKNYFHEFNALIIDENNDFKLYVKYTKQELKKYKDIKEYFINENFKDDDNVIVTYFEIIDIF